MQFSENRTMHYRSRPLLSIYIILFSGVGHRCLNTVVSDVRVVATRGICYVPGWAGAARETYEHQQLLVQTEGRLHSRHVALGEH